VRHQPIVFDKPEEILEHSIHHIIPILPVAIGAGILCGSPVQTVLVAIFSGIFIDIDHVVDYLLEVPRREWTWRSALKGDHLPSAKHVYVFLHGYDVAVLLGFISALIIGTSIAWGIVAGAVVHIATDQWDYQGHPLRYVLAFRAILRFPNDIFVHSQSRIYPTSK
jgi:hypothetical protein